MSQTKAQLIDPVDGTIVNADINASAAIAGSKISPDFGSQNIITTGEVRANGDVAISNAQPTVYFTDTGHNPDYMIRNADGALIFNDVTNSENRLVINTDGHVDLPGNLDVGGGIDVTGNIIASGDITANGGDLTVSGSTAVIHLTDTNNDDDFSLMNENGNFRIRDATNSLNRLNIDSSGTVNVTGNLDVGAGIDVTGAITSTGNYTITNTQPKIFLTDSNSNSDFSIQNENGNFNIFDETNSVSRVRIISTGNVGIGKTSPSFKLDVEDSTNNTFRLGNSGESGHGSHEVKIVGGRNFYHTLRFEGYSYRFLGFDGSNINEKFRVRSTGGVTFNGDTADANALDDYEEGTWSPTLTNTFATGTASGRVNVYRKIGSMVFFTLDIFKSASNMDINTNGDTIIGGLPFTPLSSFNSSMNIAIYLHNASGQQMNNYIDTTPQIVLHGSSRINNVRHLWGFGCYPVSD